jgi:hypothetical protein
MVSSSGWKIPYSFLYREYINHITLLISFFYLHSLICDHPLV